MGTRHRSELFLVRLKAKATKDGSDHVEGCGKVQRVVDGQSHNFSSWQGLVDLLSVMISNNKGR